MCAAPNIQNGSRDLTTPLYGWFVIHKLGLDIAYLYTELDD